MFIEPQRIREGLDRLKKIGDAISDLWVLVLDQRELTDEMEEALNRIEVILYPAADSKIIG